MNTTHSTSPASGDPVVTPGPTNTAVGVDLSVVVPCFNEAAVIQQSYARLAKVLTGLRGQGMRCEVVFVDDGSRDQTLTILRQIQSDGPDVRVVSFSRNFGHQIAVTAGLDHAAGRAVVIIDADLQDPPELIPAMVEKWRAGFDVVYAQRKSRAGESGFKVWTAKLYYRILDTLSDTDIPKDTGDFRLIDRKVVDALARMPERARFLRGMVSWVGFRQTALAFDRDARAAGETKYPFRRMLSFAATGLLAFSTKPLHLATYLGLSAAGLALVGVFYALILRLMTDIWVSGWTLLFIAVLFMGGVQLLVLGVIGHYIGQLHEQSKGRPLYFVAERHGFDDAAGTDPGS